MYITVQGENIYSEACLGTSDDRVFVKELLYKIPTLIVRFRSANQFWNESSFKSVHK